MQLKKQKIMKHTKTFEQFINESTDHGDLSDEIGGGNKRKFKSFFKSAKKGDTFMYAPNGVELDYISKENLKDEVLELETIGSIRDTEPLNCEIIDKKKVALSGGSFDYEEDEKETTIFFTMEGDTKNIYVLTDTF